MDLAKALGLEKYYIYIYIYPESNGFNQLFLSKEKFYQSNYKYGIGNYLKKGHAMNLNKNSKINNFDHYMLFRNAPFNDFWNPGVDNGEGNYILYNISPVESYSVR